MSPKLRECDALIQRFMAFAFSALMSRFLHTASLELGWLELIVRCFGHWTSYKSTQERDY